MSDRLPRPIAYLRLSRTDERTPGTQEEKWETRRGIVRELAARHDLALPDECIYIEQVSGAKVANRPILLALLDRAARGEITHVITPYQDRLLRGSRTDEDTIEGALCKGRITLISTEEPTGVDMGSDEYDPLAFEVRGLIARQELRGYKRKRRETNKAKAAQGKRYCGYAPYGYLYTKPVYEGRTVVTAAHYETLPNEYPILCEIWRRIANDSIYAIALDLQQRYEATGHPQPPGIARTPNASTRWLATSIAGMLHNPFYAGYPTRRTTVIRDEVRVLPRADWIMSTDEQDYPHPVNLATFERVQRILSERTRPGAPKTGGDRLLTGLLYCSGCRPMSAGGTQSYKCGCLPVGEAAHASRYVSRIYIEGVALHVLRVVISSLPTRLSAPSKGKTDRAAMEGEYALLRRRISELDRQANNLMIDADIHKRLYGEERWRKACEENATGLANLNAQAEELLEAVDAPDYGETRAIIERIRAIGLDRFWALADVHVRRELLRRVIERIDIEAPPSTHKCWKSVTVRLRVSAAVIK